MSSELDKFNQEDLPIGEVRGKTLHIVGNLPPDRCGVATYVDQQRIRLSALGARVKMVTMMPEAKADLHVELYSFRGLLSWLWFCGTTHLELLCVHFTDGHFFPNPPQRSVFHLLYRLLEAAGLWLLGRRAGRGGHLIVHEIATGPGVSRMNELLRNFALGPFQFLECHTETNRKDLLETYVRLRREQTVVVPPRYMVMNFTGTKEEARAALSLPSKGCIFLCLGLIAPSKGMERAIRAFRLAGINDACLHVVGGTGVDGAFSDYIQSLKEECDRTPAAHFHFGFLSEQAFDCWLQAADVVVLPYRNLTSSGVGARASVYQKPLILSDLPSLEENFPNGTVFRDETHLAEILRDFAEQHQP